MLTLVTISKARIHTKYEGLFMFKGQVRLFRGQYCVLIYTEERLLSVFR